MNKRLGAVVFAPVLLLSPLFLPAAGADQGPGNGATCTFDPEARPRWPPSRAPG